MNKSLAARVRSDLPELVGRGFDITRQTPGLQAIGSEQMTRWVWEVTPVEYGERHFFLSLSAHIDVAGKDAPLVVRTFYRDMNVEVTIPQRVSGFVEKNCQWLWAAILVPTGGFLWRHWRKRPSQAQPAPKE
jgi:hypothetical protein